MNSSRQAKEATRKLLVALWEKNLPVLRERLDLLDAAVAAAVFGRLTTEQRKDAGSTAHKLAGSLGMFGYPKGTELARQLEQSFDRPEGSEAVMLQAQMAALREELGL